VQPAATVPLLAVEGASRRGAYARVVVRLSGVSLVEASVAGAARRVRRIAAPGEHVLRVPLARRGGRVRPGRHRIGVVAVDGAGGRASASVDVR
jgi:hypothetical protein